MKVIDVSGIGHSGKTAVTDILREVRGFHVHDNSFEFDLLRLPDGILDLEKALCDNWSPIRSDFAIKRFKQLALALEDGYSETLNSNFKILTQKYVESLIIDQLHINGWYDELYKDNTNKKKLKIILKKIGFFSLLKKIYRKIKTNSALSQKRTEVHLVSGNKFYEFTKAYLQSLLFFKVRKDYNTVVVNNAFEAFKPENSINYFDNAFSIVVLRDPRDIYASILLQEEAFIPSFEDGDGIYSKEYLQSLKKNMLGVEDIKVFIKRQELYMSQINFSAREKAKILYINYEDLVLQYEKTVAKIFSHLKINQKDHTQKKDILILLIL